jgi:hypothetical protein
MQITIDLPQDLEQDLMYQSMQTNIPLQTLIIQSLRQFTRPAPINDAEWPDEIMSYTGMPDFPAFESYRDELLPLREPELF